MRRVLGVILAFTLLPAAAQAADAAAVSAVREELAGIEAPVRFEKLQGIPGAEAALLAIASDEKLPPTTRAKAVVALKVFPTDATLAFLNGLMVDQKADESLRTRAPIALAEGFKERALPTLTPALADGNKWVRKAVAQAVAKVGTPEAVTVLKARATVETEPVVKRTLEELTRGR